MNTNTELFYEQRYLSCVLTDNKVLTQHRIKTEEIYSVNERKIYKAIKDVVEKGGQADKATVTERFMEKYKDDYDSESLGNAVEHILYISDLEPTSANAEYYAKGVRECADKRTLAELIKKAQYELSQDSNAYDIGGQLIKDVETVLNNRGTESSCCHSLNEDIGDIVNDVMDGKGAVGLRTGYPDLDKVIHGFLDKALIILGARPGQGKSALALNIAYNVARVSGNVLFVSMEMSEEEIGKRLLSIVSGMSIPAGKPTDEQRVSIVNSGLAINSDLAGHIIVDDSGNCTIRKLRDTLYQQKAKWGDIKLVVVDYLQLMTDKASSRTEQVSNITRGLKTLAMETDIPILALSQLSRNLIDTKNGKERKPHLSDLRDSGSIEQDANVVLMLYEDEQGIKNLFVAKNRHGQAGTDIQLIFDKQTTAFKNKFKG